MVHHILRTSTQSSNAFRSESFPQSRSSCCSAFARESAVYRICPKAAPRFLAQAARAAHSISTVAQPSAFRCATISLVSRLHRFRGRFCIPGGRKIVIGCTLIPQRFGRDKKFVLCHFGQHAARACRNNFPAPASNETIHKLRRSGRSQWGLTEAEFFAVIFYNINRVGLCDRLKMLCNCRARLGGIGVDGVPQKSKDAFLR